MGFGKTFLQDFAFSLRQLKKSPGFTITAIVTLAFGIGANLAIFGLLYALMLRSLPVPHARELVRVIVRVPNPNFPDAALSFDMLKELQQRQRSFADLSIWSPNQVSMKDEFGTLKLVDAYFVSGNAFQVMDVQPLLGRLFVPSDDTPGGPTQGWPVVLSYNMWKVRFKAEPNIIGTHLLLSDTPVTIVGVLPNGFQGVVVGLDAKLYLPFQFQALAFAGTDTSWQYFWNCLVFGRLKPGVSMAQANAEIAGLRNQVFEQAIPPDNLHTPFIEHSALGVTSGRSGWSPLGQAVLHPMLLLECLVGIVLALCCVNIAGLLVARNQARRHEFAVRAALGAGRLRLARQCLTEGFMLALAGSILGLICAWLLNDFLLGFLNPNWLVDAVVVRPDSSLIAVAAFLALLTALLFGVVPAISAGQTPPAGALTSRSGMGARRQWAARAFIPVQIGLSLILVMVAGLFSHSMFRMLNEPLGFKASNIIMVRPEFERFPADGLLDRYQQMVERLDTMPGMRSAALTLATPIADHGEITGHFAAVNDNPMPPDDPRMAFNDVSPDYFKTMQIRLIAGREFHWDERERTVCLLNRLAADFLFPHRQPIGLYVRGFADEKNRWPLEATVCRVIGLVEDAKYVNLKLPPPRTIYFPLSINSLKLDSNHLEFMMRADTDAQAISAYRKVAAEYAPTVPVLAFFPLQEQIDRSIGPERLMSLLSVSFALLALLLSAIGLYGLLATSVTQRTSEIGVRIALGAQRRMVLQMILNEAGRMIAIGILLGSVGAIFAVRAVKVMLYNTSPFDPAVLLGSAVLLSAIALLAAFLPARHAASIEPMEALRAE